MATGSAPIFSSPGVQDRLRENKRSAALRGASFGDGVGLGAMKVVGSAAESTALRRLARCGRLLKAMLTQGRKQLRPTQRQRVVPQAPGPRPSETNSANQNEFYDRLPLPVAAEFLTTTGEVREFLALGAGRSVGRGTVARTGPIGAGTGSPLARVDRRASREILGRILGAEQPCRCTKNWASVG